MKIILLAVVLITSFLSIGVSADQLPALIKVSSFAEKTVDPNIMNIQIEIWAKAQTSSAAQDTVGKLDKKFRDLTEKFKIKKEDLQTVSYSVSPEYSYEQKTGISKIQSYSATHSVTVAFKNIDSAGAFIEQVTYGDKNEKSGIILQGINWDSDKKAAAESECISQAVKSARIRADDLAKAAGVKISGVYLLSNQQVFSNFEALTDSASRMSFKKSVDKVSVGGPDLNPGKIKVRADVSVEYYIQN